MTSHYQSFQAPSSLFPLTPSSWNSMDTYRASFKRFHTTPMAALIVQGLKSENSGTLASLRDKGVCRSRLI